MITIQPPSSSSLPVKAPDRSSLLQACLDSVNPVCLILIGEGIEVQATPLALARGLISIGQQLRSSDQAKAFLGTCTLRVRAEGPYWQCQMLLDDTALGPALELPRGELLLEMATAWDGWNERVLQQLGDPLLQQAWLAQSADLALLRELIQPHAHKSREPGPQTDFFTRFQALSGAAFPFPEMREHARVETHSLYRGPRPDPEMPLAQRLMAWSYANRETSREVYFLCLEDKRLLWVTHSPTGSSFFEDYVLPGSEDEVFSSEALIRRLSFFGRHHGHFRDGLCFQQGQIAPCHEPIPVEKLRRLNQVYVLSSLDGAHRIRIQPDAQLILGRDAACDVTLPAITIGRRQAILQNRLGVFTIEDAGSPSGNFVNDQAVKDSATLKLGDLVRMGSLVFAVEVE